MNKELLICFYGDDFTGSTDAMEVLTKNGLRTVLFLDVPDADLLKERFPDLRSFGVAGVSRTMNPVQMDKQLKPLFQKIKTNKVPIFHYKTCSTFDSSAEVGSIGKVIDIGREILDSQKVIPLLVSAPSLNRYTVFGNHFATIGHNTYRLDRHPVMSQHPVTPMDEADLRVHLSKQTDSKISLFDIRHLADNHEIVAERYDAVIEKEKPDVLLFDALTKDDIKKVGNLIWNETKNGEVFVVGSSGVEYALTEYWSSSGLIEGKCKQDDSVLSGEQVIAVSGSCSPITQEQVEVALDHGFVGIKIAVVDFLNPVTAEKAYEEVLQQAYDILENGKSPIIYSALGPKDPSIEETKDYLNSNGEHLDMNQVLGQLYGRVIKSVILNTSINRVIVAGGDTSSYSTIEMGVFGLEMIAPIAPGAPLCRCYSEDPRFDGVELALKGGQLGQKDYFVRVQSGNKVGSKTP